MDAPTAVFDLDGTLVDTAPDLVATLNHVFVREGLAPVPYDSARNMVGGGARVMIERGLKAEGRTLSTGAVDLLVQDFVAHYAAHIADHSRPFPGVEDALDELAHRGCRLAVCTNKLEWLALRLLDILGLSKRFAAICGADTFGTPKPDPAILRGTIARAGGQTSRAVMIGDSITDIATARALTVPVIAVEFGYSETPVADLDPDRTVSAFVDIPRVLFELAGPALGELARDR